MKMLKMNRIGWMITLVYFLGLQFYLAKGASNEECVGRAGAVMFTLPELNGNLTGIQRFSKKGKGDSSMSPFANYNVETKMLRHLQNNRNITVEDNMNLHFEILLKGDEGDYGLSLSVSTATGTVSKETQATLRVKDPCFDDAELVDKCYVATCFTSEGGTLKYKDMEQSTMEVKVCDQTQTGVYNCCSPTKECISQTIKDPAKAKQKNDDTTLTVVVPIVIVTVICLAIVAAVALVVYRKRRNRQRAEKDTTTLKPLNQDSRNQAL